MKVWDFKTFIFKDSWSLHQVKKCWKLMNVSIKRKFLARVLWRDTMTTESFQRLDHHLCRGTMAAGMKWCCRSSWEFYVHISRQQKVNATLDLAWAFSTSKPTSHWWTSSKKVLPSNSATSYDTMGPFLFKPPRQHSLISDFLSYDTYLHWFGYN